ncbi:MAG: serine/threonine protein kinase [Aggregatilineales bacterium]
MNDKTQPADALIGKQLGQFTILEEIGRGGMATVYSAMQQSMNRKVAVKILPVHFMHDPGFLERFEREVEVISSLEHPHILPIYEYGETDGVPYIAMRYLGGGSMAQMVRRGVPEIKDLDKAFSQVASALDYAHLHGVIHRDLKPGNIMLDEHGNAYLSDFGIARVMGSDMTGSAIIGTPAYMSPEQAHGMAIDARSDIYALGIVLFELITGREPYQAETPMGLLLMHINEPLPDMHDLRDDLPYGVVEVIETATAKEPDERYSSAGEMAEAFSAALRGEDVTRKSARTKSLSEDSETIITGDTSASMKTPGDDNSATIAAPLPDSEKTATHGRSRPPVLAIVAVLALILAGGVALAFSNGLFETSQTPVIIAATPFRSAETVDSDEGYLLSVPERWNYVDSSNVSRIYHKWDAEDEQMYAAIAIPDDTISSIDRYDIRYYANEDSYTFIDDETAPDGTVRRSYRVENSSRLANGQLDVFYQMRDEVLTVVEIYTADEVATANTTLETMQLILDSLRVKES